MVILTHTRLELLSLDMTVVMYSYFYSIFFRSVPHWYEIDEKAELGT